MITGIILTEIATKRVSGSDGKLHIHNRCDVTDVSMPESSALKKKKAGKPASTAEIRFSFSSEYESNKKIVGEVRIQGRMTYSGDNVSRLASRWKKEKKLPDDIGAEVINAILGKCSVAAIIVAREVLLPPPVPLLRVQAKVSEIKDAKGQDLEYVG